MKTATVTIESVSPYSQSRHYAGEIDKLEKESAKDYEKRTWRNRLHFNQNGEVFIPPMALKNCLSEAAKYLSIQIPGKGKATYTKHIEAGVSLEYIDKNITNDSDVDELYERIALLMECRAEINQPETEAS